VIDIKAHLRTLVEAHGPSGHEGPVRDVVRAAWADLTDSMELDGLGSLIGIKRATDPINPPRKIMLAAHMDEIGMMVRDIVDGFIYVHRISGVDNRVMLAQPVIVHGREPLPGIVAAKPTHLLTADERKTYPGFDELVIDVGLPVDEVEKLVRIGDLITPDAKMTELQGKRVAAKALDDRASVATVTACLDLLRRMRHRWDVYATATVQEEVGHFGAAATAYKIQPDIAIALDVTFAEQPGVDSDKATSMGGGPAVGIGPNFHDNLRERIIETAKRHEIKVQDDPIPGRSGTDAWDIQVAREGVSTLLLSLPIRNMHSAVETLDLSDVDRTARLLAHFIAELDADFMTAIDWDELKLAEEA
jgi:tetrahedral aminopeptidase